MESPMWWTWVWVGSGSWWWTEKPGGLLFMGSERVRYKWETELNWTENKWTDSWKPQAIKIQSRINSYSTSFPEEKNPGNISSLVKSTCYLIRKLYKIIKNIPEKSRISGKTSQSTLWCQHHTDTIMRQRKYRKWKVEINTLMNINTLSKWLANGLRQFKKKYG